MLPRKRITAEDTIAGQAEVNPDQAAITTTIRMPGDLRRQLEAAAAEQTRNLSQEIERRLRRSFNPEALVADAVLLVGQMDRFTEASKHILALAKTVFGFYGEVGYQLMRDLALAKMLANTDMPYKLSEERFQFYRDALSDLQRNNDKRSEQGTRRGQTRRDPDAGKAPLDKRPEYLHVRDALAARIAIGEWKPGTPIQEESELARQFGVSAKTMRKALDLMESDGLLTRRAPEAAAEKGNKIKATRRYDDFLVAVPLRHPHQRGG